MLLSIAYGTLALVLVLVVVSVSSIYIERKRLLALADAIAADAADAVDIEGYFAAERGQGPQLPLTDESVRESVLDYLSSAPSSVVDFESLALSEPTGSPDGSSAQVTLSALARPPLPTWVLAPWQGGFTIEVTVSARAS